MCQTSLCPARLLIFPLKVIASVSARGMCPLHREWPAESQVKGQGKLSALSSENTHKTTQGHTHMQHHNTNNDSSAVSVSHDLTTPLTHCVYVCVWVCLSVLKLLSGNHKIFHFPSFQVSISLLIATTIPMVFESRMIFLMFAVLYSFFYCLFLLHSVEKIR